MFGISVADLLMTVDSATAGASWLAKAEAARLALDMLMAEGEVGAATVWLTKREAAKQAHVTPRTITNWVKRGWLRAGGTPGKVLIRQEWLDEMLERRRDGHGPDSDER